MTGDLRCARCQDRAAYRVRVGRRLADGSYPIDQPLCLSHVNAERAMAGFGMAEVQITALDG